MKKASYRLLQWTMLMGSAAILATACVVTSGDDDFDNSGGEGGTSSTAGKTSTEAGEGGTSTAGTSSGGSATGGSAGSGTSGSTTGGSGGSGSTYVPGECGSGDEPTMLPSCDPSPTDEGQTCKICLKAKCCTEWKSCYGDTPTSACGWGATAEADGQFDCIQNCYLDGLADATDLDELQAECESQCLNQCEDDPLDDGFITPITNDLMGCVNQQCQDECFPATVD